MKCQIKMMTKRYFGIRKRIKHAGNWLDIDIPEEVYEEIKKKLNEKPYTGIHGEIMNNVRCQTLPSEVVLDYLYCNGFDYLFEEEHEEPENQK